MKKYQLRCALAGHEKDVRSVAACLVPDGGIVSGSRDVTARIWIPNEIDAGFLEGNLMSGHSGFVACVCVLPPSEEHPHGLIATGSNDNNIHIYDLETPSPLRKLEGHKDTVCCLSAGKGTLLSGSWDKTAKVWLNGKNVMTLSGHNQAVWCVAMMPEGGCMVTGSADKLIKIWKAGRCVHTLKGHDDCVRGLAVVNSEEFLSCSNDSSIRRWSAAGQVLQVYYSHSNFVYGVSMIPGTEDFVSVSEDRSLKIWRLGECCQTIAHPATTVWCVCVLRNGDIATGSSDGIIRVFTESEERTASPEDIKAYEGQVAASIIPTKVGDIDSEKLPGQEALIVPGTKDGEVKMVKVDGSVEAYQWSQIDSKWMKVGEVVGSAGGSSGTRTLHEGKEYDYVFSVDVEEGKPPLKLPYNMTEDPWLAAQKFITKHGLSQLFLEEVHGFIVKNSQSVSLDQDSATSSYVDPYTGAGRYMPGSTPTADGSNLSDPFTGAGRYVPGAQPMDTSSTSTGADPFTGAHSYRPVDNTVPPGTNPYFPQTTVVTFNTIKVDMVIKKLKEFNKQLDAPCAESNLNSLAELCQLEKTPPVETLQALRELMSSWPDDKVFPLIDVLRVSLRNPAINSYYCDSNRGPALLQHLTKYMDVNNTIQNQMLSLRCLANMLAHPTGVTLIMGNREIIVRLTMPLTSIANKNVQAAAATVLLNLAVLVKPSNDAEAQVQLLSAMATAAASAIDADPKFRLCVGLGTLIWQNDSNKAMAESLEIEQDVRRWKSETDDKLRKCAEALGAII